MPKYDDEIRMHFTFDSDLELKDAGLVAASAAAQVGGSNRILDLGSGALFGTVVIDVSAIEVASGDELYQVGWQLSNESDFASDIFEAATVEMGDAAVLKGDTDYPAAGERVVLPVHNVVGWAVYRYARLYTTVSGTVATGINYSAYLAKGFPTL